METNKKKDYGNQVITHSKDMRTERFSWNFLLILYVIGVLIMIYILFAPIIGEISLWTYFKLSSDNVLFYLVGDKIILQAKIFICCVVFKAISLSIWLGENI